MSGLFVHRLQLPFWHNHANLRNAQWNTVCSWSLTSTLFQTRLCWDVRCNFSRSVAILSITGIYFTHLRVLGADKLRAGQRQLMSQLGWHHPMPGNYSEGEGKQTYPDKNSWKLRKRLHLNTWLLLHSDPTCLIAQASLLHNTPGETWQGV